MGQEPKGGEGGSGGYELAGYVVPPGFFSSVISQSKRLLFVVTKEHVGLF